MKIAKLTLEVLNIPFKYNFEHASAQRCSTEALWVKATTKNNIIGLGEGCPRVYVTGETLDSAKSFFDKYEADLLKIESLENLTSWISKNSKKIDKNPAAFCAIELAILHALAQELNQTLEQLLNVPKISGAFAYTAILGSKSNEQFVAQLKKYREIGFIDYKIKIFGDPAIDEKNIASFYSNILNGSRLRLDANNLWGTSLDAANYINSLFYGMPSDSLYALEEPLNKRNFEGCLELVDAVKTKIILDESFAKEDDFLAIQKTTQAWILNIRVSKMGGLIRSLSVAEHAKRLGVPIIVGAQVGETSLLTRAAITVANTYKDNLVAQEGAFGTHLLQRDLINPPLMFGKKGLISADQVPAVW